MQLITLYILVLSFNDSLKILPSKDFKILIPRLIASFFMHSTLEPYVRRGIAIMKYVVNHPQLFRIYDFDEDFDIDEEEEEE